MLTERDPVDPTDELDAEPTDPSDAPHAAPTAGLTADPTADTSVVGDDDPPQSLLANTSWLIASRLVVAVLGWAGTLLIARSLDLEEFGRFTLIFTLLGVMSIVTDMGIGRIAVRGILGHEEHDASRFAGAYIALRTTLGLIGYALVVLLTVILGYPTEVLHAMLVAGLVVVLATPSAALDVVFQARLRMGAVSVLAVCGLTAQLALTAALAAAGGSLLLFTLPAVLCQVVVLVFKAPLAHRLLPLRLVIDRRIWFRLIREAVPLTLGFGLATVYYRVDAIMLSQLDTFDAVGIYGVSYKFIDVIHFAGVAVTVPLLTVLVQAWPDDSETFRAAIRRASMLIGLLGGTAAVGLLGFAGPLTSLLYGSEYAVGASATKVLVIAQMGTLFTALVLTCLIAMERHRLYPWVMLAGVAVNIGANFVLIPLWSYRGAAIATLGSEVVVLSMLVTLLRRERLGWPSGLGRLVMLPVAIAVAWGVGWVADQVLPWALAAAVSVLAYAAVAILGGLFAAAGLPGTPARVTRLLDRRAA